MPGTFNFDANTLEEAQNIGQDIFSTGPGTGVDDPLLFSVIAANQAIETDGDVDIFAMTIVAGQTVVFDVDDGAGDPSGGSIDLQLDLIDAQGNLVDTNDDASGLDLGTFDPLDPRLTFTATETGTYFIAIHEFENDYSDSTAGDATPSDDGFTFDTSFAGTGDYSLVVSTANLAPLTVLSGASEVLQFSDLAQRVQGGGGDDVLAMKGGDDVVNGQRGNDVLTGGFGEDDLMGGKGLDKVGGGAGNDVVRGGQGDDNLRGGAGNDDLKGNLGNDTLGGGGGNDDLWGNEGADTIKGGGGQDFIRGGAGIDQLTGGAGADRFHFIATDSAFDAVGFNEDAILDFAPGDRIDLSDVILGTLTFLGTGSITNPGEVAIASFDPSTGFQEVLVNISGDSTPELAFLVTTTDGTILTAEDFIL